MRVYAIAWRLNLNVHEVVYLWCAGASIAQPTLQVRAFGMPEYSCRGAGMSSTTADGGLARVKQGVYLAPELAPA
jgi:hypothetical protein